MQKPTLIAVGGPSGSGKTEIISRLVRIHPSLYQRPVSFTTRSARPRESNAEYQFISRQEMMKLSERGLLANLDEVYGNLYGMSRDSVDQLNADGIWAIKEIHPSHFQNLRKAYPDLITAVILPSDDHFIASLQDRGERAALDTGYYKDLDTAQFDIVRRSFPGETTDQLALSLHEYIHALLFFGNDFPRPPAIDALNKAGYSMIAAEFTERLRPTTANFHELSLPFLRRILSFPKSFGRRYLEIGPGQGWLRSEISLEGVEYDAVEIADTMAEKFKETNDARVWSGSARDLRFRSNYFDVVIASLGDPFCYPSALLEISRVLKVGGRFILTAPAKAWTEVIRPEHQRRKTSFTLSSGGIAQVYSFTFDMEELESLLAACHLRVLEKEVAPLRGLQVAETSPVLIDASQKLGRDDIPILNMVYALKEQRV